MAQISINKWNGLTGMPETFVEQMQDIAAGIRHRAFELFQGRNPGDGSDLEDWLEAEREGVWSPPAELVDEGTQFRGRVALPGFVSKDIEVFAMPHAIVVRADASDSNEGADRNVHFREFSDKRLFRRLDLPGPVDVDKVSASFDHGVLQLIIPKAAQRQLAASAQSGVSMTAVHKPKLAEMRGRRVAIGA